MRNPPRSVRALIFAIVVVAFMLLGCLPFLHAQSTNAIAISNQIVSPGGAPAQNAAVLVCQITAIGSPCATTGVVLYADPNLIVPITNPVATDQYGNYAFFTTTGAYQIQVTPAGASGPTYVYYYINQTSGTGNGSVTAVGLSLPTDVFNVTGSPITTAGTLTGAFVAQAPNLVFAGPTVGPEDAAPTFRYLVAADIPTGLPYVTSVGFAATPTLFTVSGQPITTSGTIMLGVADQQPNYVFAGPPTGTSAGAPTFRQLVTADFPTLYYQSVQINGVTLPPTSTLNFSSSFASTSTSPTTAISLAPTTVTAGSYACVSATINQFGQITAASSVGCTGDNVPPNTVFAGPASGGPGPASWQVAPTFSAANLTSIPAVTNISVTTANGVSANIINSTTTPNLTFTLGAITPSSVASTGPVTGTTLTGSLLAPYAGDCVSIGSNGQLTSTGSACGTAGGGSSFSVITSGVNTGATMTVAAGATLNYSAGGILNASAIDGVTVSGTAAAGYASVATSASAATWQLIPGLAAANVWTGTTNSFQALIATTLTASGLSSTSGNCVQIASGGTLSSSGQPCNASPSFAALTTGTNTAAAMTVGAGASMTYAGGSAVSGGINANYLGGIGAASFCQVGGTNCAAPILTVTDGITYSTLGNNGTLGLGAITPTSISTGGAITAFSGLFLDYVTVNDYLTVGTEVEAEYYVNTGSTPTCAVVIGSGTCSVTGRQSGGTIMVSATAAGPESLLINLPYAYPSRSTCVVSGNSGSLSSPSYWFIAGTGGPSAFEMENFAVPSGIFTVAYICNGY